MWMGGGRLALGLVSDYVYISDGICLDSRKREKSKILAFFYREIDKRSFTYVYATKGDYMIGCSHGTAHIARAWLTIQYLHRIIAWWLPE